MNFERRDVPRDYAAGRSDRAPSDVDAWANQSTSTYPGAVFNGDRLDFQPKSRIGPVMVTGAEVHALRKTDIGAKSHRCKVIDPDVLADPGVRSDREVPGIFHANTWLDNYAGSDACSEKAKQETSQGRERLQLQTNEWQTHEEPQKRNQLVPAW